MYRNKLKLNKIKNMSKLNSSEMPEPQTLEYMTFYKITPLFVSDLKKVLSDTAYVDAIKFFNRIDECKNIMSIAVLNEFIRDIGNLPYKTVNGIMSVINNSDKFVKYFEPIDTKVMIETHPELVGVPVQK